MNPITKQPVPTDAQYKREFLRSVWLFTKSASLTRQCKAIYEGKDTGLINV